MKIAIHQPQYWPWPPYMSKIMSADLFVVLDHVQFSKNGLQNRNKILTPQGETWLTLPVRQKLGLSLAEIPVVDTRILAKHYKTIAMNYARTPGFIRWQGELKDLLSAGETLKLADINLAVIHWMMSKLGITTPIVRSSSLEMGDLKRGDLVVAFCRHFNADIYLSGSGALAYMSMDDFREINCQVQIQRGSLGEYPQAVSGKKFVPHLSCLDLLLNSPDEAGDLIESRFNWSTQ